MIDRTSAVGLVEAYLKSLPQDGTRYSVVGSHDFTDCWAVGIQAIEDGPEPRYDVLGFEVDKSTGAVTQWTEQPTTLISPRTD